MPSARSSSMTFRKLGVGIALIKPPSDAVLSILKLCKKIWLRAKSDWLGTRAEIFRFAPTRRKDAHRDRASRQTISASEIPSSRSMPRPGRRHRLLRNRRSDGLLRIAWAPGPPTSTPVSELHVTLGL